MKLFLPLFCIAFLLFSCSGSDSNFEPQTEADIIEYIEANNLNAQRSSSGLYYVINELGTGVRPTSNSNVTVAYRGTLLDGTVFDSSVDRGEPAEFQVNRVIKGWTEGLQLMSVGSKYKFFIPQDIAYGAFPRQGGEIKPFDVLIFEVELLEIKAAQ